MRSAASAVQGVDASEADATVTPTTPSTTTRRRKSLRLSRKSIGEKSTNSFDGSVKSKNDDENDFGGDHHSSDLLTAFTGLKEQEVLSPEELVAAAEADKYLDNFSLRYARANPMMYLRVLGNLFVCILPPIRFTLCW